MIGLAFSPEPNRTVEEQRTDYVGRACKSVPSRAEPSTNSFFFNNEFLKSGSLYNIIN